MPFDVGTDWLPTLKNLAPSFKLIKSPETRSTTAIDLVGKPTLMI